jgi:hypothetical protein
MAASTPRKVTPRKVQYNPKIPQPTPAAQPADVGAFKKLQQGELVLLPSGLTARITRPGIHEFLKVGFLPDALRPTIENSIRRGQGLRPQDEKALAEKASQDPKFLEELMRAYDLVVVQAWRAPTVVHHEVQDGEGWRTLSQSERDPVQLYTDEIGFDDKAFTFNFAVGGVRDLQRFRAELAGHVEPLLSGEAVEMQAE